MSEAPNTDKAPAVTFIDEPGVSGFDRMFGTAPAEPDPTPNEPEPEEPETTPQPTALPQEIALRLATLEAQNQHLAAQLGQVVTQRSTETLQSLLTKYEDAIATGNVAEAERLRKEVEGFKAPVAPAPVQPQSYAPQAPAGHWSHNVRGEAEAWTAAQPWWRVDGARTKAVMDAANLVDPVKFTTRDAYFTALLNTADELAGRKPAKTETTQATPQPRVNAPAPTRGAPSARAGEITSLSQLRGAEREAAEQAINYGGLSEAQYLASYNDVRRMQSRAKKG